MKNIILIFVTFASFAFVYIIIKRLNHLLNENRHWISHADTENCSTIRVSAESPDLLASIEPVFASYSANHPRIAIRFGRGTAKQLLEKLDRGNIHIALLSEEHEKYLTSESYFHIHVRPAPNFSNKTVLEDRETAGKHCVCVVWNKTVPSKERDRLLFVLENEQCHSTCGYCDYLD